MVGTDSDFIVVNIYDKLRQATAEAYEKVVVNTSMSSRRDACENNAMKCSKKCSSYSMTLNEIMNRCWATVTFVFVRVFFARDVIMWCLSHVLSASWCVSLYTSIGWGLLVIPYITFDYQDYVGWYDTLEYGCMLFRRMSIFIMTKF